MSDTLRIVADMLDGSFKAPLDALDDPALIGLLFGTLGLPFSNNVRGVLARLAEGEVPPAWLVDAARADVRAVTATCEEESLPKGDQHDHHD
jgi:hypothetical protein